MAERLKFALFGNIYQAKKSASVKQLISLLAARDAELYIDTDFYTYLSQELHFDVRPTGLISDSDFQADIAVSMGGDGTFLAAASRVGSKDIPILHGAARLLSRCVSGRNQRMHRRHLQPHIQN